MVKPPGVSLCLASIEAKAPLPTNTACIATEPVLADLADARMQSADSVCGRILVPLVAVLRVF
jgi:hypothetical protein